MSFDRLPRSVRAAIRTPADLLTEPDATVRAALIPARALDDEGRTAPLWLLLWSYRAECFHVEEAVSTVAHGHEFLYRPRSQGAPDYIPLYFGTQGRGEPNGGPTAPRASCSATPKWQQPRTPKPPTPVAARRTVLHPAAAGGRSRLEPEQLPKARMHAPGS